MTIPEILKEVEVVKNVVSPDAQIQLKYLNVEDDESIKEFAQSTGSVLHSPDAELPYFWVCMFTDNVDVIIKGKVKKVKLIY